ncbi:MAG: leucine-rich repeat domain-containing protein, partial [Psychrosphaera sp.]|nr:leucine-rich repeat domain-containing protein [Psychrosphaera sp.]
GIEQFDNLKSLNLILNDIEDISPVANLTQLTGLGLWDNKVKDIVALSNLSALQGLTLSYNDVNDISPLAGLNKLTLLTLAYNEVNDLSALSGLNQLRKLRLQHNQITDVLPLYTLTGLGELNLSNNDDLYCNEVEALQQVLTSTNITNNCTADLLINDVTFIDANLQSCVLEHAQTNSWETTEQVTKLTCHDRNIVTLEGIEHFDNLKSLNLILNDIEDISPLGGLTKLTGLGLFDNKVKDVTALSNLTALQGLTLAYNDINNISPLAGLKKLTSLSLHFNEVGNLSTLSHLTRLRKLTLQHNQITDLLPLYRLTQLGELNLLNNDYLYCESVDALQQVLTATKITQNFTNAPLISAITFTDANLQACINEQAQTKGWEKVSDVTSLFCHDNQIERLDGLDYFTALTSLNLSRNVIADLSALANLTRLKGLGLWENKITDLAALRHLTALQGLTLKYNDIEDLTPLSSLSKLSLLTLEGNNITDISALLSLNELSSLTLENNNITDISPLANKRKLTELTLKRNKISDITALATLPQLTKLDLAYNQISTLAPNPQANLDFSHLVWLNLMENNISGAVTIGNNDFSGLKGLYLENNEIDDISALAELTLTGLDLRDNQIENLSPLASMNSLEWLNLTNNKIANLDPLASLIKLESLSLNNNKIVNLDPLVNLSSLDTLLLENNQIEDLKPLHQIASLRYLNINNNTAITCDDVGALLAALPSLRSLLSNCDNAPPIVDAGPDLTVAEQSQITLNGQTNDPDGSISGRVWRQTSGPLALVPNNRFDQDTLVLVTPAVTQTEVLTFKLAAVDNRKATASDSVNITVTVNTDKPVVNAGLDSSVEAITDVYLSGSAQSDTSTITGFHWTQTQGPEVSLGNASQANAYFTSPNIQQTQTLIFKLTATDDTGLSNSDLVAITVTPIHNIPVALAGPNQSVNEQTAVSLFGSGTTPSGYITDFLWRQTDGTSVTINDPSFATLKFAAPQVTEQQVLHFELMVTNKAGKTDTDTIEITVLPVNLAPESNAGSNQVAVVQNRVTLSGSATDSDGSITGYQWTQTSGTTVELANSSSATATFKAPKVASPQTLGFTLSVTDNEGAKATDSVF